MRSLSADMMSRIWFGLLAPAKTVEPVIMRFAAATSDMLRDPAIRTRLTELSAQVVGLGPSDVTSKIEILQR